MTGQLIVYFVLKLFLINLLQTLLNVILFFAALCGSALADGDEILKFLWQTIIGAAAFEDSVLPKVDSNFIIM